MAFRTRCPECRAKLEFDEAPDPDEAVECTRCGHVFDGAEAKPLVKKKKVAVGGDDDAGERPKKKKKKLKASVDPKAPKKRKVKKKKANLLFLWIMLGFTVVLGPFLGWFCYKLWFAPGKVGELMSYVPQEANLMRGIDVARLSQYPGYEAELKRAMEGPFATCRDEFAKAAGVEPKDFLDYALSAKIKEGGSTKAMYVFQTLQPFDAANLEKPMGGKKETVEGQEVYRMPFSLPAPLGGALVFCPKPKHIVIVATDGDQQKMLKQVADAQSDPKEKSMYAKLATTGKKVTRANIWTLLRCTGDYKDRIKIEMASRVKNDYNDLSTKLSKCTMFGVYMYFGNMIRFGVAIDTESDETASEFIRKNRESEDLGKGDETEFKRDLKIGFPFVNDKDFRSEFMGNLRWRYTGDCAIMESRMSLEKAMLILGVFNKPTMFEGTAELPQVAR